MKIQNTVSGSSSLYLSTNMTNSSVITQDVSGNLYFRMNISNTSSLALQLYSNGVVYAGNGNSFANNKMLILWDGGKTDSAFNSINYHGFGINAAANRYQVPTTTHSHKFYCGDTLGYTITNTGGANGSDIRFKTDIQNITNAISTISNLQGKTFYMNGDTSKRQMGYIAQQVIAYVPEIVWIDTSDENNFHYLQYEKLVPLLSEGIKELDAKFTLLASRVSALESV